MGKKVLVVDDEPDTVTFFTVLLQEHGYATVSASDGREALEMVERERPDLVTLDLTMPEVSGVGVYRRMREDERLRGIPVIVVTAVAGRLGDGMKGFLGSRRQVPPPDGYIEKPVKPQDLVAEVRRLIG